MSTRGQSRECTIVVVGDVMLDIDLVAEAERLSPEAPVPVLHNAIEHRRPGGAGLAALLAAGHRHRVVLIAPLSDDEPAAELRRLLATRVELVPVPYDGSTPVKTRLRVGDHPVARLDSGDVPGRIGDLPEAAQRALDGAAVILVADYGRGFTAHPGLRTALEAAARRAAVVWDPHPRGARPVAGTLLATPNAAELNAATTGDGSGTLADVGRRAAALAVDWGTAISVTLGPKGAMLCVGDAAPFLARSPAVRAADTCGAGDSYAAAVAAALADGCVLSEAVTLGTTAASAFVAAGAASGLAAAALPHNGRDLSDAALAGRSPSAVAEQTRARGGVVVATGGCFDLLHAGHIATLEAARALGDCLIVCVNSDDSVRRLKGVGRPLQPATDRARVLAALACVDAVLIFDEDTPEQALDLLRPHVWAKGGDYTGAQLPESQVVEQWGGIAVTVPYLTGRSTTALVRSAAERNDPATPQRTAQRG